VTRWREDRRTSRARRTALAALTAAGPVVLGVVVVAQGWAGIVAALVVAVAPVLLVVVGLGDRSRFVAWPLALLAAVQAGAMVAVVAGIGSGGPVVFGLPLGLLVFLGGLWLVPMILVALIYGLAFDRAGVPPEDLEHYEALRRGRP